MQHFESDSGMQMDNETDQVKGIEAECFNCWICCIDCSDWNGFPMLPLHQGVAVEAVRYLGASLRRRERGGRLPCTSWQRALDAFAKALEDPDQG
jgi:hypothetical protein